MCLVHLACQGAVRTTSVPCPACNFGVPANRLPLDRLRHLRYPLPGTMASTHRQPTASTSQARSTRLFRLFRPLLLRCRPFHIRPIPCRKRAPLRQLPPAHLAIRPYRAIHRRVRGIRPHHPIQAWLAILPIRDTRLDRLRCKDISQDLARTTATLMLAIPAILAILAIHPLPYRTRRHVPGATVICTVSALHR